MQAHVTDSVVNEALHRIPESIFRLSGERVISTLKARLADLPLQAIEYYRFLAITVDVAASDKHELFDINYTASGNVLINIFKIKKDGEVDKKIYQREFVSGITKEVRLYGFDGNDIFSVSGEG